MATQFTYNISDFPNDKVNSRKLTNEIMDSSITIAIDYINTSTTQCDIFFKTDLSSGEETTLDDIVAAHDGVFVDTDDSPRMADGRMIVRADSRPLSYATYFTMCGDDSTAGIGEGTKLLWDFSNDDDLINDGSVPSGMKCKQILLQFLCPVYMKDGTLYFKDAPWGCFVTMDIVVPPSTYYPNPAGPYPAAALGLSGTKMYANSGEDLVSYQVYLMKHMIFGDCPMGDEINAEGSSINPVPPGWYIRGRVYTPISDTTSKGYGELEIHRCHTTILPGMTPQDIINSH